MIVVEAAVFIFFCVMLNEQRDDSCHVDDVRISPWLIAGRVIVNGLITRSMRKAFFIKFAATALVFQPKIISFPIHRR